MRIQHPVGELSKQELSGEFTAAYNHVPWKQINGLRNRIVHGYEGVRLNIIWDAIINDLPLLRKQLLEIVGAE